MRCGSRGLYELAGYRCVGGLAREGGGAVRQVLKRSRTTRVFLPMLVSLATLSGGGGTVAADDGANVWVRGWRDIEGTVAWLRTESQRIGASQVIVAFDAPTFAPPPGLTEFTLRYAFFRDIERWTAALLEWGRDAKDVSLRAATSRMSDSVDLTKSNGGEKLGTILTQRWWEGEPPVRLDPAVRWIRTLLQRTESAARQVARASGPRMFVLVTGPVPSERWVRNEGTEGFESAWRTRLCAEGAYWAEEDVAAVLRSQGAAFYPVAPEAFFSDFAPIAELPQLPWASRPQHPGTSVEGPSIPTRGRRGGVDLEAVRRAIEAGDLEALRRLLEAFRLDDPPSPTTPRDPDAPHGLRHEYSGLRFESSTPRWFPRMGSRVLWNNHAPSGYGHWPLARVAAKTGGRYLFYPFPQGEWLDRCPANVGLLDRLAPELVALPAYLGRRRSDQALDAIGKAMALLVADTPWSDGRYGVRPRGGWTALPRTAPLRLERDVRPWQKPIDHFDTLQSEDDFVRLGHHLQEVVLPQHAKALALLDAEIERIDAGRGPAVHPRSAAHLRLTAFWTAMSAFHLSALAIYATEVERFIPLGMLGRLEGLHVTYVPTIRMSDCLEAYDGRRLTADHELGYPRWNVDDTRGYQGNILDMEQNDPNYRAQRDLVHVFRHLDKRLVPAATTMVERARDVMTRYAETGWGWTTYYSEAYTFVFTPVTLQTGPNPSSGESLRPPPRPTTPRGPLGGGDGSTPTGPTTGGG